MNKQEVYAYLTEQKISYEVMEHRALSFASPDDEERRVHFYLDQEFQENKIGIHPNENTATIWLQADDLMRLILVHGNEAEVVEIG